MMTLVIYDISDGRVRARVERRCKDFGLKHIQRSAFIGILTRGRRMELFHDLMNVMKGNSGAIRIYVMDKRLYSMSMRIGRLKDFDEDPEYGEEERTLIF